MRKTSCNIHYVVNMNVLFHHVSRIPSSFYTALGVGTYAQKALVRMLAALVMCIGFTLRRASHRGGALVQPSKSSGTKMGVSNITYDNQRIQLLLRRTC